MAVEAGMDVQNTFDFDDYELDAGPTVEHESPRGGEEDSRLPPAQTQLEDLGVQDLGVDEVVAQPAIRKPRPTLNADRLLDPRRGYPALLKSLRQVKYRGRGDEKKYLQNYVMTYQIWANRVWPKATFNDFMIMARRVGTDPRIRRYCRSLIEEEKYGRDELPADAPKDAARESTNDQTLNKESVQLVNDQESNAPTEKNSEPVSQQRSDSTSPEIDSGIPPEFDFLGDVNETGPDADELEAAMELYGDMDF